MGLWHCVEFVHVASVLMEHVATILSVAVCRVSLYCDIDLVHPDSWEGRELVLDLSLVYAHGAITLKHTYKNESS